MQRHCSEDVQKMTPLSVYDLAISVESRLTPKDLVTVKEVHSVGFIFAHYNIVCLTSHSLQFHKFNITAE